MTDTDDAGGIDAFLRARYDDDAHVFPMETAAHLAILDLHQPDAEDNPWCRECENEPYPCRTLRHLAAVYRGAPNYQKEWAPWPH